MALPYAFQERLRQMEETRNQRLTLLQAEKELQNKKSLELAAKFSSIRYMEQRCLILEQKNAGLSFNVLAKKSEIESLEAKYQTAAQQFRALKSEQKELEERERDKERFYETKSSEMMKFMEEVNACVLDSRLQVQKMKNSVDQLKSSLEELQSHNRHLNNSEIAAAEARKAELLVAKEDLERSLASNYQLKAQLQKQLQRFLISHDHGRRKVTQSSEEHKSKIV